MTIGKRRREALRLDHASRAKLAHDLPDSLDDLSEGDIEQLRLQEAVRRHDAIVAGEVETIRVDEVVALAQSSLRTANSQRLLDLPYHRPVVSVSAVAEHLDVTFSAANSLVAKFCDLGILRETTGGARRRRFAYERYVSLLRVGTERPAS
jgi:hypothetical protein